MVLPLIPRVPDVTDKDRLRRFCDEVCELFNPLVRQGTLTLAPPVGPASLGTVYATDFLATNTIGFVTAYGLTTAFNSIGFQSSGTVEEATNATPIVVKSTAHGLTTGRVVTITGAKGNTGANIDSSITVVDVDHFSLDSGVGNGTYVASSGSWLTVGGTLEFTSNFVDPANPAFLYRTVIGQPIGAGGGIEYNFAAITGTPNLFTLVSNGVTAAIINSTGLLTLTAGLICTTISCTTISCTAITCTTIAASGTVTVTSNSASALAVGRQGATSPALQVDASTGTSVTGLKLKAGASGGGFAVSVVGGGTNENVTFDAKGSGTFTIAGTSTGQINLSRNTAVTGTLGVTGAATVTSSSASALAVGRQGATNPGLQVDASAASCVTGILVTSNAAGSKVVITATSTAADEDIQLVPKGIGHLRVSGGGSAGFDCGPPATFSATILVAGASNLSGGILGVTTNSNATAGNVGEIVSATVASGIAVGLANATGNNVTSISLTAGDWDVEGNINFTLTGCTMTVTTGGLSSTTGTLPTDGTEVQNGQQGTTVTLTNGLTLPRKRFSLSGTTTVYLVAQMSFSAGTASAYGAITARRVR